LSVHFAGAHDRGYGQQAQAALEPQNQSSLSARLLITDIGAHLEVKEVPMSTLTTSENTLQEAATYGGLVDAIGGIVTIVLAIIALSGVHDMTLAGIATIVFGVALLIQGGTMLTEYTRISSPIGASVLGEEVGSGGGLSALFLVGIAGIVLGVLALLNIYAQILIAVAVIAFGAGLLLSSNSVWHLYRWKKISPRIGAAQTASTGEVLASEMAAGSAVMQCLAGLAAGILGILSVTGTANPTVLALVGLLVLGATVLLTGSSLSAMVMGFMEPGATRRGESWSTSVERGAE
jgi:hypothetical protein